ncbi:hypothetical protein AMATHDRAFT_67903 [Amanita thiersii Skay4041]|uniref:Uncharacterized protein n=1 Tax=Amanita thiersii Skay4041 TaxID=703135 RepID=A0A2A9NI29_9AGAR|nr:hypothetical protein AMATHDRAFT_67903 [Amanita thiersii Skay4041]
MHIWAIYLQSRKVAVLLLAAYLGMVISVYINVALMLRSVTFASLPLANAPTCFIIEADRKLVFF